MIQVFFSAQLSNEQVLAMFERAAAQMRAALAAYDAIPQQLDAYSDYTRSPREFLFWMLTLEVGQMSARANLAWIENVIERFKNGEVPQA